MCIRDRDNLLLWYRGSRKQMESDLKDGAASMLGVDCMLDRTAGKLSGGMKKRLSIACALSNHAPVLIMDEPGAALDLECKEIIRNYLREYMASGGAVILTSHELAELALCTRMCILKGGVLRAVSYTHLDVYKRQLGGFRFLSHLMLHSSIIRKVLKLELTNTIKCSKLI